jgi:hypothetical protein
VLAVEVSDMLHRGGDYSWIDDDVSAPSIIVELMRELPPAGSVWPRDRQLVFIQALDALVALKYGGSTHLIWIGEDGEIKVAAREV